MAKRKASEPLTKVTLNLYEADYLRMHDLYPKVGATVAIRELVRQHVSKVLAKTQKALEEIPLLSEIELEEKDLLPNE